MRPVAYLVFQFRTFAVNNRGHVKTTSTAKLCSSTQGRQREREREERKRATDSATTARVRRIARSRCNLSAKLQGKLPPRDMYLGLSSR